MKSLTDKLVSRGVQILLDEKYGVVHEPPLTAKVNKAIKYLQTYEPKEGYYVAFSGGKDSIVIYDLVKRANVKHDTHHSITTIDPPEMLRWIKVNYPEVERHKPEMSMFELVTFKKSLPTRIGRFCCEYLKESGGNNRVVVLGVRSEESSNRKGRKLFEWYKEKEKLLFNIILDWTEKDVWEYIDTNKLKYPKLYDEGHTRIGCIGCPFIGGKQMRIQFEKYPHIKKGYLKAIKKAIANGGFLSFTSRGFNENDIFDWWTSDLSIKDYFEKHS